MKQKFFPMKGTNRAQTTRVEGIALVVPNGVFHVVEAPCDERVDHRHGTAGFGQGGRPVEMEQPGGFNEHEQLLGLLYPLFEHGTHMTQASCCSRSLFLK